MDPPAQAERATVSFLYLFAQFKPSKDWAKPAHISEGNPLYSVYQLKC